MGTAITRIAARRWFFDHMIVTDHGLSRAEAAVAALGREKARFTALRVGVLDFPEGIGPVACVNVEHQEVLLIPRRVESRRVTFTYGLGDEFTDPQDTPQARSRPHGQGDRARR